MTLSGGKPHNVGDKGQRYEVSFFDPKSNERRVFGWSNDAFGAQLMAEGIEEHPGWQFPQVKDREAKPFTKKEALAAKGETTFK